MTRGCFYPEKNNYLRGISKMTIGRWDSVKALRTLY